MSTTALWVEITIAGATYLAGVCFLFLGGYKVPLHSLPSEVRAYLPYLSVVALGASYIVGILMHRVAQSLDKYVLRPLLRTEELHTAPSAERHFADLVMIWQFGSERLLRELDFQFSLVSLLRSLVLSIPFAFGGLEFWLVRANQAFGWGFLTLGLSLWVSCLYVYRRQCRHYQAIELATLRRIRWDTRS